MADNDQPPEGEGLNPDGWGVYHLWAEPLEGVSGYLFGPFPTEDIARLILAGSNCQCQTSLVPLFFPPGIQMMAAMDASDLPKRMRQMLGIPDVEGDGSPHLPDRVH